MPEELISGKVPLAIEDPEFCGIETESNFSCFCGFLPVRKVAYEGVNTGRRFICCMREVNLVVTFISFYQICIVMFG